MKSLLCLLGFAILASPSIPLHAANLLTNGSFETGTFVDPGNGAPTLPVGSKLMEGWTTVNAELSWNSTGSFQITPENGSRCLDLTGFHDSYPYAGVTQTIATTIGTAYQVSFYLGTNSTYGGPAAVIVKAGNQSQAFTTSATTGTGTIWQHFTYVFTAVSTSTPITLTGTAEASGQFVGLDNVSVDVSTTTPPPVNLVVNGDFEDSTNFVFDGSDGMSFPVGSKALPGWTTYGGELHVAGKANPYGIKAQNGQYSIDLTGYHDAVPYGGIMQTITTTVGHTYDVTFYLGVIPGSSVDRGPDSVLLTVGSETKTFTSTGTGTSLTTVWTKCTYSYTATSTSTKLAIGGTLATGGQYIGIDNVSMIDTASVSTPLPQPTFANGGFELGTFVDDSAGGMFLSPGSTVLTGWKTVGGKLTWTKNTNTVGFKSKVGNYSLNLIGPIKSVPYGGITQTVTTVPGTNYQLTYFVGSMPAGDDAGLVGITVHAGNESITNNFDATGADGTTTVWAKFTFIFKAVSDSTVITFNGNTATGGYIGLDAISLAAVKLQTISFPVPASSTVGQAITLNAVASSGLPVTYSLTSGTAKLVGNQLTFTGVGVVKLLATQAGDATYAAASTVSSPQGTSVGKGSQTISALETISSQTYGNDPVAITFPTATSGLAVTVKVTGPAYLSGKSIVLTGVGTVTVTATQAGNANYTAAPVMATSFTVAKASQAITFPPIASTMVGGTQILKATSTTKTLISYKVVSGNATVKGNVLTYTGTGSITVEADQAATDVYLAASATIITSGRK